LRFELFGSDPVDGISFPYSATVMISHVIGAPERPSVGGEQRGFVPLGGGDVDCVGVAQRPGHERPCAVHVDPWCRFDQDLKRLCIVQRLREIRGLEGMAGSVHSRANPGHDRDCEVPRRAMQALCFCSSADGDPSRFAARPQLGPLSEKSIVSGRAGIGLASLSWLQLSW
jgi:hypothetical protein